MPAQKVTPIEFFQLLFLFFELYLNNLLIIAHMYLLSIHIEQIFLQNYTIIHLLSIQTLLHQVIQS